jgi:hypothetical protein
MKKFKIKDNDLEQTLEKYAKVFIIRLFKGTTQCVSYAQKDHAICYIVKESYFL